MLPKKDSRAIRLNDDNRSRSAHYPEQYSSYENSAYQKSSPISTYIFSIFSAIVLAIGILACEGPAGPEGPEGDEGPEGPVGPAGEDGSQFYSDTGAPGSETGSNGDYYLNTNTGELYGPKDSDGWGTPAITLKGEDGDDGSQIYSGDGAPDSDLGMVGDYYLDKTNYELFGPKTDSGWGAALSLKGTANVMYSDWIDFTTSEWSTPYDNYGQMTREYSIEELKITQEIVNQGIVKVYINFVCCNEVKTLPLIEPITSNGEGQVLDFNIEKDSLHITMHNLTNITDDPNTFGTGNKFRYVIIPGGTAISDARIDWADYNAVLEYFEIKD